MTVVTQKPFGKTKNGEQASIFTLDNHKMNVLISNYGATIVSINVTTKSGDCVDVNLGYDDIPTYEKMEGYIGATIGRYANRINKAKFSLNGKQYDLFANDGQNHLHGGKEGFDKKVWDSKIIEDENGQSLQLHYLSKDGEENYDGNLDVTVTFSLTQENRLKLAYKASTDKETVINLTNHAYFNLNGHNSGNILEHTLMINSNKFTPIDKELIPTGEFVDVKNTALDFTTPTKIGARITEDAQYLCGGYDHNFVITDSSKQVKHIATVTGDKTNITMKVYTDKPAVQLYTSNMLEVPYGCAKGGAGYKTHAAFCLETQFFPDSPNKPHFSNCVLKPNEVYDYTTIYEFTAN